VEKIKFLEVPFRIIKQHKHQGVEIE